MKKKIRIALFGTSADPPTIAHGEILIYLGKQYDQVAVWAADNPFKQHGANLAQRTTMLGLLVNSFPSPLNNISVYATLSDRRSLITLEKAQQIWGKEAHYFLVIGSDLIVQLSHWYKIEILLSQVDLLIFPREGYPILPENLEQLQTLGGRWQVLDFLPSGISSSLYRQALDTALVPTAIATYISQENLYRY